MASLCHQYSSSSFNQSTQYQRQNASCIEIASTFIWEFPQLALWQEGRRQSGWYTTGTLRKQLMKPTVRGILSLNITRWGNPSNGQAATVLVLKLSKIGWLQWYQPKGAIQKWPQLNCRDFGPPPPLVSTNFKQPPFLWSEIGQPPSPSPLTSFVNGPKSGKNVHFGGTALLSRTAPIWRCCYLSTTGKCQSPLSSWYWALVGTHFEILNSDA